MTTGQTGQRLVDVSLVFLPREGYSHTVGYAYARMARVWFLPISVLERVGFCTREGMAGAHIFWVSSPPGLFACFSGH